MAALFFVSPSWNIPSRVRRRRSQHLSRRFRLRRAGFRSRSRRLAVQELGDAVTVGRAQIEELNSQHTGGHSSHNAGDSKWRVVRNKPPGGRHFIACFASQRRSHADPRFAHVRDETGRIPQAPIAMSFEQHGPPGRRAPLLPAVNRALAGVILDRPLEQQ